MVGGSLALNRMGMGSSLRGEKGPIPETGGIWIGTEN